MKEKVLQVLRPKVSSLGFSKDELEGVAETISANLTDESTEEQITQSVEAVIPYLKVSQSVATRVINLQKRETPKKPETEPKVADPEEPTWFKAYREETEKKLSSLIESKSKETRKAQFSKQLEGLTDLQKDRRLKDFERMSFTDDEDFTNYLVEIQDYVKKEIQENTNDELSKINQPVKGGKVPKEVSDKEIQEVLNQLNM